MNKRHKKRLLNVAKACREMKEPAEFDMRFYSDCGTPACAFGNYAFRNDLQKSFHLTYNAAVTTNGDPVGFHEDIKPHFGLTINETIKIFDINGCGGAKTNIRAAEYIENFVREQ